MVEPRETKKCPSTNETAGLEYVLTRRLSFGGMALCMPPKFLRRWNFGWGSQDQPLDKNSIASPGKWQRSDIVQKAG